MCTKYIFSGPVPLLLYYLRIIAKEISHLFFAIDQVLKGTTTINSEMIGLFVKSRICYIEYCLFYPLEQLN